MHFAWNKEADHVIQRADGTAIYHLANVVDDHDFEITHVIAAANISRIRPARSSLPKGSVTRYRNTPTFPLCSSPAGRQK